MAISDDGNRLFVAKMAAPSELSIAIRTSARYTEVINSVDVGDADFFQNNSIALHGNQPQHGHRDSCRL